MIRRIAIFRALQLGDLLLAVPALRAIRRHFPYAEITLIGLPWAAAFVERYSEYIDRFVEFAGYPGINEVAYNPERCAAFLDEQRRYKYDLVIQMHGSGQSSNPFALDLQGRLTAGYYEGVPPGGLTMYEPYPHGQHEIVRNLGLAALLGCTDLRPILEFPLNETDHMEAAALLRMLPQADRPWIGMHVGARPPVRRWPVPYFARLADQLVERFGAQIILTGNGSEKTIVQSVIEHMHAPAINLAGRTSLGGLAALICKLDLFISNDTGPAHVANALHSPSITIFGPAEYERWKPLDQELHPSIRRPVACSPCSNWECPIDHRCLRWIEPSAVLGVAERLLHTVHQQKRKSASIQATRRENL